MTRSELIRAAVLGGGGFVLAATGGWWTSASVDVTPATPRPVEWVIPDPADRNVEPALALLRARDPWRTAALAPTVPVEVTAETAVSRISAVIRRGDDWVAILSPLSDGRPGETRKAGEEIGGGWLISSLSPTEIRVQRQEETKLLRLFK